MSEIRVNNLSNESNTGGPSISGITTFSSPYFFVPPVGNTEERPENPEKGAIRFNTDSGNLEYFQGDTIGWAEVQASNEELNGGYRGILIGGNSTPNYGGDTEYLTISTLGSSATFGNMNNTASAAAACGSRARWVNAGGNEPGNPSANYISYHEFASLGDSNDFGDLSVGRWGLGGLSNQTRGVFTGGSTSGDENNGTNTIDYITIASTGNAVDFGDKYVNATQAAGTASPTRGLIAGGETPTRVNTIQYITMSTLGNSADFGDITRSISGISANGNAVRCIFGAGEFPSSFDATMDYVTISTLGNALNFGELTFSFRLAGTASSPTRGVWMGGTNDDPASNTVYNTIQYVQTMSTGNAIDFGDLSTTFGYTHIGSCSNGHGGLG